VDATFYAYDNGAVEVTIQENYPILLSKKDCYPEIAIDKECADYLNRFYLAFFNSDIDELIQLSHEDPEWIDKHIYYHKKDQEMDSIGRLAEYRKKYSQIVQVLDRMII
jgi:hypothetical protein